MDPSTSGGDVETQATLFLSHSGVQKGFVEYLYDTLKRAHYTCFFDKYSLKRASPFPPGIKEALLGCKLGVIVLSDDFLSSNWPMIELALLLSEGIPVLPLFYRITPEDLKRPEKWKDKWINIVNKQEKEQCEKDKQLEQWEKAVKQIRSNNGLIYENSDNEFVYIERVVKAICGIIPPNVEYDLRYAQGHPRLTKEIEGYFDKVKDAATQCQKACMIGLHGVGGLGKTTLCKGMVNFFTSEYLGRSCLIEFPTDCDKTKIVEGCKAVLKKLANLNDNVLEQCNSLDQVVQLMKAHVAKLDVFIAIDNVMAKSEEDADRLLGIGFSDASKVLVTSRSGEILESLFSNRKNSYICLLPSPNQEEAFLIFQKSVDRGDITSSPVRNVIDRGLEGCVYNGKYHPLALKALGGYMRSQFCGREVSRVDEGEWSRIFERIEPAAMQSVEATIKLNYDGLEEHMKHMFLDIVVCIACTPGDGSHKYRYELDRTVATELGNSYAHVVWWLYSMHNFNEIQIKKAIYDVALAGVIQIEKDAGKTIRVHDLYTELAWKEVMASPRFLMTDTEEAAKEVECQKVERVICKEGAPGWFVEKLRLRNCQQIKLFDAQNVEPRSRWVCSYLPSMPSLRYLRLHGRPCKRASFSAVLAVHILRGSGTINLSGLVQLQRISIHHFVSVKRLEGLDSLLNLRNLYISDFPNLKELDGLERLTKLEVLFVIDCRALKKVTGLGSTTSLKCLRLSSNTSFKELEPLSSTLKRLCICNCDGLIMPNMVQLRGGSPFRLNDLSSGRLVHVVEYLKIEECTGMRKIDVGKFTGVRLLEVRKCERLKEIKGLSKLHQLQKLVLHDCQRLENISNHVQRWSSILVEISGCPSLKIKVEMTENFQSLGSKGCSLSLFSSVTESHCAFCFKRAHYFRRVLKLLMLGLMLSCLTWCILYFFVFLGR